MRLLNYSLGGDCRCGLLSADGDVIDLTARIPGIVEVDQLLTSDSMWVAARLAGEPADYELAAIEFERPIALPRKIYCVGVNYRGRNAEYRDGVADADYPSLFVRYPDSLVAHLHDVIRPRESVQFDCEGEIVVVIGRAGRRISVDAARDHIAGLTLGNDGTLRDWVAHGRFNVTQGKHFEATGALGPWLVTLDEIGDLDSLRLTTRVNGELVQDASTATMRYPIADLVSYVSTWAALLPGDLIFTGTPLGSRGRRNPPEWLVPGDVIEIDVAQIGTLRNTVVEEAEDD